MARKILLADDSVTAQNMGRRILSEAGYEVVTVNNGPAALKKIAEYKPHLVILDVYMPGYGGLEVCQQIKAGEETAHIPVLLTVGKLEPFKADEARRVRADGHLVKPFEASELLTILTKLEERIVPEPDPKLQSRLAGPPAGRSSVAAKGKGFGDADSGWKERLSIPSPAPKPKLLELEHDETNSGTAFRTFAHEEEHKPAESAPAYAQLAREITAEEIAAITAAAAAFAEKEKGTEPASQVATEPVEKAAVSLPPVAQAPAVAAPEPIETAASPETVPEAGPPESTAVPEATAQVVEPPEALEASGIAMVEDSAPETAPAVSEVAPAEVTPETDVVAALEALAPVNGRDAAAEVTSSPEHQIEKPEEVPVSVGTAADSETIQGPRWIADEVALTSDEASLVLEREMQKVYAAMAEINPEALGFSSVQMETPSLREAEPTPQPAELPTPQDAVVSQAAETPYAEPVASEQAAEPPIEGSAAESSSVAESAASEFAHSADAVAEPPQAATEQAGSQPQGDDGVTESATAYAAAASAGPAFRTSHTDETPQTTESNEATESSPSPAGTETRREREAELAAAWANWRQVRESLASPQFVSQVADATAAEFENLHPPTNAAAAGADSAAVPENPGEIANIVDNVLAELKPKLVKEIAKKLGKEK